MKQLLGWMHRKFRQNSNDPPIKDFIIGNTCNCFSGQTPLDDPNYDNQNLRYGMKTPKQLNLDHHSLRNSFTGLASGTEEEDGYQGQGNSPTDAVSELFHGFLAIGTLGSENGFSGPSTPTFPNPVEKITERDAEVVTETELKLINDELEKVLLAEAKDDSWCNVSSGRTSHVSAGRSSHGSTITLGARESTVCPLQDFLFGSAIEISETKSLAKKENRTSLGELFQRTKITEDNCRPKCDAEEMEKEVDRSTVILMKEKLKKILHSSSLSRNNVTTSGVKTDSISQDKTLTKILNVFHRKIHPNTLATGKTLDKQQRKKKHKNNKGCKGVNVVINGEDIVMDHQRDSSEELMQQPKSKCSLSQFNFKVKESNENRECWIKTDADYLVLEL